MSAQTLKKFLIIPAGGSGQRFQTDIPKQFIPLAGKPVLMHTVESFMNIYPEIEIILILPDNHIELWKSLCDEFQFNMRYRIVSGGESRFESVKNGLDSINEDEGIVGVHDGVRPFPGRELISRCFEAAALHGSAVPVMPITDSLRKLRGKNQGIAVDRDNYVAVQTPQCFQLTDLKKAYASAEGTDSFTDDAMVMEHSGHQLNLVEGAAENIKITRPADLHFGEALMNRFKIR